MSNKKPFSGSTMTLKDFHGGSIPSDLPLPSAPGVNGRSSDRTSFDRYSSWGNPIGRFDSHLRPLSSPASRNFDCKTPFLSSTSRIGRTFDEDERKPLEAASSSSPRRAVIDDGLHPSSSRVDLKSDSYSLKFTQTSGVSSLLPSQPKQVSRFSDAAMTAEKSMAVDLPAGGRQTVTLSQQPNAWAARKEAAGNPEMASALLSAPSISSKFAQASALDKVSSGRWQSKQTVQCNADVEVIHHENEPIADFMPGYNAYTRLEVPQLGSITMEGHMSKSSLVIGSLPAPASDVSERPILRLLPRTKPLESWELPRVKQGNTISEEIVFEAHENVGVAGTGFPVNEKGNQLAERPKLNLKPRSQPVDLMEGIAENGRNTLFGGARPRELVLKERGSEDVNSSGKADYEKGRVDSGRNSREQQERARSPDTWRRPAERQLTPWAPNDNPAAATRNGKVASPAELAQSFSRSVSDPGRPPSGPLPPPALFSRLVGPTTRRSSINGY